MEVYEVIAEKVKEIGITKSELARRVGISDELLRRSLSGSRKLPAGEFLKLCGELCLGLTDFDEYKSKKKSRRVR